MKKLDIFCGDVGLCLLLNPRLPRSPVLWAWKRPGLDMSSKLSVLLTGVGDGLPKAMWLASLRVSSLGVPCGDPTNKLSAVQ